MSPCVSLLSAISRNYICSSNHGISIEHYTLYNYVVPFIYIPPNSWHILEQIPFTNQPTKKIIPAEAQLPRQSCRSKDC